MSEKKKLDAYYWGGVLLWAGLVFGAESLGFLPQIGSADAWSWVFLGAGLYGLAGSIFRRASDNYSNPSTWDWAWGGIFTILGLGGFTTVNISWPLIIILVGVVILGNALFDRS
jgi:hypothetical protein